MSQCPCRKLNPIDHQSPRYGFPLKETLGAQAVLQDAHRVLYALFVLLVALRAYRLLNGIECIGWKKFGGKGDLATVSIEWVVADWGIIAPSEPRFALGGGIIEAWAIGNERAIKQWVGAAAAADAAVYVPGYIVEWVISKIGIRGRRG